MHDGWFERCWKAARSEWLVTHQSNERWQQSSHLLCHPSRNRVKLAQGWVHQFRISSTATTFRLSISGVARKGTSYNVAAAVDERTSSTLSLKNSEIFSCKCFNWWSVVSPSIPFKARYNFFILPPISISVCSMRHQSQLNRRGQPWHKDFNDIWRHTNTSTHARIVLISGAYGICLFRAIAQGITRD